MHSVIACIIIGLVAQWIWLFLVTHVQQKNILDISIRYISGYILTGIMLHILQYM